MHGETHRGEIHRMTSATPLSAALFAAIDCERWMPVGCWFSIMPIGQKPDRLLYTLAECWSVSVEPAHIQPVCTSL